MLSDVMEYFPQSIKNEINLFISQKNQEDLIDEIRLRVNQDLSIKLGQKIITLKHKITIQEMAVTFENICEKSIYSYTKQIAEGFITIKGGNRVGVTGSCVIENGKVINMNYISSLNFRIARQIKEVSQPLLKYIVDIQNNTIFNTIIASPPGARKNNSTKRPYKENFKWYARN